MRRKEMDMIVRCNCEECKHNEDGYCGLNMVYISNSEMTAAGFLAQCTDYDERGEHETD